MKPSVKRTFTRGFVATVLFCGCVHRKTVSEAEVAQVAAAAAITAGYKLSDFKPARVQRTESGWSVSYDGKIPLPDRDGKIELKVGNHFLVRMDDRAKKPRIVAGE